MIIKKVRRLGIINYHSCSEKKIQKKKTGMLIWNKRCLKQEKNMN